MNKCKCGCGADAPEGKGFLPGHWSKWFAKKKAIKIEAGLSTPEELKQPEEPRITVSNIRACGIKLENVAWFKISENEYDRKDLEFFCTITNEKKEFCDYVAVVIEDGSIVPVILMPGFIGIHPRGYDPEEHKNEEIKPEPPETKDTKMPPPEEKPAISQPDEPKDDDSEALRKLLELPKPEKKQGWVDRFIHGTTG